MTRRRNAAPWSTPRTTSDKTRRSQAEAASTYGWVLYKLGRLDEAEKAFQAAISGGQVAPDTAYYIACLSYDRGREPQAKQWLERRVKEHRTVSPCGKRPRTLMETKLKK